MFNKKNQEPGTSDATIKSDPKVNESTSKGTKQGTTVRTNRGSPDDSSGAKTLLADTLGQNVSDHIIAGPHGALQPPNADDAPDRWSFMSTHTLLMRRHSELNLDEPVDFETAILETGHGCFQYKLMVVCGLVYACCSLSTTTLSMVLPAAQYDFSLSSVDKGVLNTAPLWGMVVGSYIWGNFADNKGRRFVLLWTLTIDSIASYLSSFCQHYLMFYILRIFNGFAIIGSTSIIFAYMGEFLDQKIRDIYLTRLELAWTFGIIALPLIGLAILPLKIDWGDRETFLYNSWRMFVFACGIPSMIAAVLVYQMPESPRFLLLQGKLEQTRKVLEQMYVSNTGRNKDSFSVKVLSESSEADTYYFTRLKNASRCKQFKNLLKGIYKQHRDLFQGRSLFNIILTCYLDFGLISIYYTMMLWVPELLNRLEHFHEHNPGKPASLCDVSSISVQSPDDADIKMDTFLHTIITCLACLPTTLMLLCLIKWVSKKALLVSIMVSSAIPAVCLAYVDSNFAVVTMLSLLKSLTNLAEAILFCSVVQIFPINTRGTALSLTVTVGRVGSIVGNLVFGAMIDDHCIMLFYIMGANLVIAGLACFLLPKMKRGH